MELAERFEQFDDDYTDFLKIEDRYSNRPDLHAFIMLDKLQPSHLDIVSAADHDEYWLGIDVEKLDAVITDDQIRDLVRCGVRYDSEFDSLRLNA